MNNQIIIASLIILIIPVNTEIMANEFIQKTETPVYRVIATFDSIEIREYPDMIMASTIIGNKYSGNSGRGFGTIASYIFGSNDSNMNISMTAPVVVEMSDTMKMSFIMPSEYDIGKLPKPLNPNVTIQSEKSRILAVIGFGGFTSDEKMKDYKERLGHKLSQRGIKQVGEYMYFGYNPPYRLINRKNEVAVEVVWDNNISY